MAEAPIQCRCIPLLDLPQEHDVFVRAGLRRSQDQGCRDRHQRERQDERRDHRRDDGGCQGLIHAAFDAGHTEQRKEDDDDDERGKGDRASDFDGGCQCTLPTFPARRRAHQPVQDVLHHDDRGVDQEADRDRQAAERHRVQTDAERPQQQPRKRDGQRNRERDDERGSDVAQEQENDEHDEDTAEHHRAADAAQCRRHELRLVVDDAQLNTFRQCSADVFDRAADASRDRHRVRAELLDDAGADDLALQPVRNAPSDRCRFPNVGDIAEQDWHITSRRHHGAAKVVNGLRTTDGADGPFDRPLGDNPTRGVEVRLLDRVHHIVQADSPRRHALGVELDLELPQIAAEPFHGRDARHGQQPVVHLEFGEIPKGHEIRRARVGLEREFEDLVQTTSEAGDQRRIGPGWQLPGHLPDPLGDELSRAVVVGARLEFDGDLRHPELRVRSHAPHVRQPGQRNLERNRDGRLELLGTHRGILRDDVEDGRRQIGEDVPRQILYPERADRRARRDQQRGQAAARETTRESGG